MVNIPRIILKCEAVASGVIRLARENGFEARLDLCDRAGEVAFRVSVDCLPADLRAMAREARARHSEFLAWQGFLGAPTCAGLWRRHFAGYVSSRWFDSSHPAAPTCPEFRGPDAFATALAPLVTARAVGAAFDLCDALTATVFIEYLSEYPERRRAWRDFQKANPTTRL